MKTSKKLTCIKMANHKKVYSAVEAAKKILNEWSDDKDNKVKYCCITIRKSWCSNSD